MTTSARGLSLVLNLLALLVHKYNTDAKGAAAGNGPSFPKDGLYVGANVPVTFAATCKQAAGELPPFGTQFACFTTKVQILTVLLWWPPQACTLPRQEASLRARRCALCQRMRLIRPTLPTLLKVSEQLAHEALRCWYLRP